MGQSLEAYLAELRRDSVSAARLFTESPHVPRSYWNSLLARSIVDDPTVRSLSWVDAGGRVIACSDPEQVGRSLSSLPWVNAAPEPRNWTITNLTPPRRGGSGTFYVAAQVRNERGAPRGVMVAEVVPEALTDRLIFHTLGERRFSIVDGRGWLVYRFPREPVAWPNRNLAASYPDLAWVLRTWKARVSSAYDPLDRELHLFATIPLPSLGWAVAVVHPEANVIHPLLRELGQDAGLLSLVALLAFWIAAAVARRVSARVEYLSDFAWVVGQGEFSLRSETRGPREIQRLAAALNYMAGELQTRQQEHDRILELERARAGGAHSGSHPGTYRNTARLLRPGPALPSDQHCVLSLPRAPSGRGNGASVRGGFRQPRGVGSPHPGARFRRDVGASRISPRSQHPPTRGSHLLDVALVPVQNGEGEVEGVVLSATEITQQLLAREQRVTAERERAKIAETVAAETNHRMKNNLSLISGLLQLQLFHEPRDTAVARALRDAIGRISALAAMHEQLYKEHPDQVELRAMLERVAHTAVHSLSGGEVALSLEGPEVSVSPKAGSMLAIVANEMLTNAIKYGGAAPDGKRHITVTLTLRARRLVLGVWNSGNPVPADFDPGAQPGLGLHLLQELAASQLEGSVSLRPAEGGTRCEVTMRIEALDLATPDQEGVR